MGKEQHLSAEIQAHADMIENMTDVFAQVLETQNTDADHANIQETACKVAQLLAPLDMAIRDKQVSYFAIHMELNGLQLEITQAGG